jgi:hypothetical protein
MTMERRRVFAPPPGRSPLLRRRCIIGPSSPLRTWWHWPPHRCPHEPPRRHGATTPRNTSEPTTATAGAPSSPSFTASHISRTARRTLRPSHRPQARRVTATARRCGRDVPAPRRPTRDVRILQLPILHPVLRVVPPHLVHRARYQPGLHEGRKAQEAARSVPPAGQRSTPTRAQVRARAASRTAIRARALLLISSTLACTATITPVSGS